MRQPEKVFVEYVGYKQPETIDELELEILGLRTAVMAAQSRIASLEQSKQLYYMGKQNAQSIKKTSSSPEVEQESGTKLEQDGSTNEEQSKE